jgi:hypothetical protein
VLLNGTTMEISSGPLSGPATVWSQGTIAAAAPEPTRPTLQLLSLRAVVIPNPAVLMSRDRRSIAILAFCCVSTICSFARVERSVDVSMTNPAVVMIRATATAIINSKSVTPF